MPSRPLQSRLSAIVLLVLMTFLATACAWREVSPLMSAPPRAQVSAAVAVRPLDRDTAIADLDSISKRLQKWHSAGTVFFPYREGDAVDVFLDIRLRQTTETHLFANVLRGVAIGLTLGLLSPVIGANFTEVHDVEIRVTREGHVIGTHHFEVRTDLSIGLGADTHVATRELDEEQMNHIAKQIVQLVQADVAKSTGQAARVGMRFDSAG
jgi:hypothetical protein